MQCVHDTFFYTKKNSIKGGGGRQQEVIGRWTGENCEELRLKYEGMTGDASDFAEGI